VITATEYRWIAIGDLLPGICRAWIKKIIRCGPDAAWNTVGECILTSSGSGVELMLGLLWLTGRMTRTAS